MFGYVVVAYSHSVGVTLNTRPHRRDGEAAYVSLNGIICWSTTMTSSQGTQQCGAQRSSNEDAVPVTGCSTTLSGSGIKPLTVRVWTNLNARDAKDESFGIANVVISNDPTGVHCWSRMTSCRNR